ncbi:hypothetical protein ACWCPK_42030 [Streptomyces sp. NPDC001953]
MIETPDTPQYREPGVRYRKVTRYRDETTVIDGVPSTRKVAYEAWIPEPPKDWDDLILRGVTCLAIAVTVIAVVGTTAAVGGLLRVMVPAVVAYVLGGVFTASWVACLGLQWVGRLNPQRANPARVGGSVALVISMGAVFTYGHTLDQPFAGGVGACIDLLAKGLWALLIHYHAVPFSDGVAHWISDQEQKLAGRALLTARLSRLNRRAAYQRAVGGREFQAAEAILTADEPPPVTTGEDTSAPVSGQGSDKAGQASSLPSGGPTPIGGSIAGTVRQFLDDVPVYAVAGPLDDGLLEQLTDEVRKAHGDRPNLKETVRRTRDREIGRRTA